MIPFLDLAAPYRQLAPEIDRAVARVLASGQFILGEEVDNFERAYASMVGADHCVGCGNGLDAIVIALRAFEVGPGDEVIVPSHTFIATWLAVSAVGATPVPVEPEPGTFNLGAAGVERAITPATRAIIAVHMYGQPADLDGLVRLARSRKLKLIEDAAQAHGATYRGRPIGAISDATTWSFYPAKNLGAMGDGGAVTTHDATLAERLRMLRNYGTRTKYRNELKGVNSRLDPIQAAVLGAKLPWLAAWNERRREIASRYTSGLAGLALDLPVEPPWTGSVWHLYVVRSRHRDVLQRLLADAGVQAHVHYPVAVHRQPAYQASANAYRLPLAEQFAAEVLSLPIGPHLDDGQVAMVIDCVRRAVEQLPRS